MTLAIIDGLAGAGCALICIGFMLAEFRRAWKRIPPVSTGKVRLAGLSQSARPGSANHAPGTSTEPAEERQNQNAKPYIAHVRTNRTKEGYL